MNKDNVIQLTLFKLHYISLHPLEQYDSFGVAKLMLFIFTSTVVLLHNVLFLKYADPI